MNSVVNIQKPYSHVEVDDGTVPRADMMSRIRRGLDYVDERTSIAHVHKTGRIARHEAR